MLGSLFGGDAAAGKFGPRKVHDALTEGLDVSEAFAQHTAQVTEELKRIQKQQQAEREAM